MIYMIFYTLNQMEQIELWKIIDGFDDYEISTYGRVRSMKHKSPRILKIRKDGCGYVQVVLCKQGLEFSKKVHRLVATHFLDNLEGKEQIDHIDRDVSNNHITNLRWVTRSENMLNTKRHFHETYGIRWVERLKKYKIQMNIKRKQTYLGCFESFEEAKNVRDAFLRR